MCRVGTDEHNPLEYNRFHHSRWCTVVLGACNSAMNCWIQPERSSAT